MDYEGANEYFLEKYNPTAGACSSMRKDSYFGRNYDWYFDDTISFVIRKKATQGNYANIAVTGSIIKKEEVESGEELEIYKYLPYMVLDGINEKGLTCNINMLPAIDRRSYTNQTEEGKKNVLSALVIRKILDECATVDEVKEKFLNEWNIVGPTNPLLDMEYHWMVADNQKTCVIEFIDNEVVFVEDFVDDKPIMTNFYLNTFNMLDGAPTGLTLHGEGIERYFDLAKSYDSVQSINTMEQAMRNVFYSQTYDKDKVPFWYSEYYAIWSSLDNFDFNIESDHEVFKPTIDAFIDASPIARDGEHWHTVHTSIYDMENRILRIIVQEENRHYEFRLTVPGKIDNELEGTVHLMSETLDVDFPKEDDRFLLDADGSVLTI